VYDLDGPACASGSEVIERPPPNNPANEMTSFGHPVTDTPAISAFTLPGRRPRDRPLCRQPPVLTLLHLSLCCLIARRCLRDKQSYLDRVQLSVQPLLAVIELTDMGTTDDCPAFPKEYEPLDDGWRTELTEGPGLVFRRKLSLVMTKTAHTVKRLRIQQR
jgi:hypothetical protein